MAFYQRFKVGDRVVLNNVALENYGNHLDQKVFIVTHTARNTQDHPGFDPGSGCALYDLQDAETGVLFNNSLYDWELE